MRIAITGASGNVGTALLRALPDAEVVAIARRPPLADREPYARAPWLACDIGDPAARPMLAAAFDGADAVVHLAWAVHPRRSDPPLERTNRIGTDHVLGAVADSVPLHPSWLKLADRACLVRAERARRELDWRPAHSAVDVATELAAGLREHTSGGSPPLNPEPMRFRPGRPTHQDQRPDHRPR